MKAEILFSKFDLFSTLEAQKAKLRDLAAAVDSTVLLNTPLEEVARLVVEKEIIEPIRLREDDITIDQTEAKVDVSRDPMRFIMDRSQPFYIDGIKVEYFVPFSGDSQLFYCKPNSWSTTRPYAIIKGNELVFEYSVVDGNVAKTKETFQRALSEVKQYLGWQAEQLAGHNAALEREVRPYLESRLNALKLSQSQIGDLGFKMRPKATPVREAPTAKPASVRKTRSSEGKALDDRQYDVALSFAGEDRPYVDQVAEFLKKEGVAVFYDKFETAQLWGRNLIDHLGKVYEKQSRFIVMFISKNYAVKSWPDHERKSAQARAVKMKDDCILPARFDETEIQGMPSSVGYIDLRTISPDEMARLIMERISE